MPRPSTTSLEQSLETFRDSLPSAVDGLTAARTRALQEASADVAQEGAALAFNFTRDLDEVIARIHRLAAARQAVDDEMHRLLELRFALADRTAGEDRRMALREFLAAVSETIDLSGRLNHQIRDVVVGAAYAFASQPKMREKLIAQLEADESTIGVSMIAPMLVDPPADSPNRAQPAPESLKLKILLMLGQFGRRESLPYIVDCLRDDRTSDRLQVAAVDAITRLGLPQLPLTDETAASGDDGQAPSSDETAESDESSADEITIAELIEQLEHIDPATLSQSFATHREQLLEFIRRRKETGVDERGYWKGNFWIQPGDWVLMRNSSPYNLFTDLSPGLFTHVGVATLHADADGIDRLVLVDFNERDSIVTGTNIETELPNAQYYAVLRHEDPEVAAKMAETAASVIGNPMQFDLGFDTSRVTELRGQPLEGRRIVTYCAGFLLLCAQETGVPRDEFFPIPEHPAGGHLLENVGRIGLDAGSDLISPTGPLFARGMQLVHFSQPMYDPSREIEQRIYDYFARGLSNKELEPRQNLFQVLRQQLADAAENNPVLADALAKAAGVDRGTDLAAAARALAVVETLDAVAYGNSEEFRDTMRAFGVWPYARPGMDAPDEEEQQHLEALRQRHADLQRRLRDRAINVHELHRALVDYYVAKGTDQIDLHFFPQSNDAGSR